MSFYLLTTRADAENSTVGDDVVVDTRNATISFTPAIGEEGASITFVDNGKLRQADGRGLTVEVFKIAAREALQEKEAVTDLTRNNISDIRIAYGWDKSTLG